jgi:phosphoglycolate phosphatase
MTTNAGPFDLVIFDLDGTLVDSLPDIATALNTTLGQVGLPNLPNEVVAAFVGDGAAQLIERAFPASDPGQHALLLSSFMSAYASGVCVNSRLYPGVDALLARLGDRGIQSAVLTNKPGALARRLLDQLAIAKYFCAIVGDGDGYPRKPDTTAAGALMRRAGTNAPRTVVVGDGLPDVRMARAIPCSIIAAGWGYVPLSRLQLESPTFVAAEVRDAQKILVPADSALDRVGT